MAKKQYEVEILWADSVLVYAESRQEAIEDVEARGLVVCGAEEVNDG